MVAQCKPSLEPVSDDWDDLAVVTIVNALRLAQCECKRAALAALWDGKGEVCSETKIKALLASEKEVAPAQRK